MTDKYDRLKKAWQFEKQKKELQNIPDQFLTEMKEYISTIDNLITNENTLKDQIIKQEKFNATIMFKEITQTRINKIVSAELNGTPMTATHLTPDEQQFHANFRQLLSNYMQGIPFFFESPQLLITSKKILEKKHQPIDSDLVVLRFLKPLPAIMGIDLKAYGPFEAEDVASIPRQNALNLIRRGIAKEVEIEP
jgi:DNA replication initiation complex subunit (GINS family)